MKAKKVRKIVRREINAALRNYSACESRYARTRKQMQELEQRLYKGPEDYEEDPLDDDAVIKLAIHGNIADVICIGCGKTIDKYDMDACLTDEFGVIDMAKSQNQYCRHCGRRFNWDNETLDLEELERW